ncbi:MAG: ACT domain-containing protein [Actinomycetota bacterium]
MPTDLTITLANQPGSLADLGEALGAAGVNIEAIAGFGTGDTGIAHLVVDDADAARTALGAGGIEVTDAHETMSVTLPDEPGALGRYARRLADAGVNIDAAYIGGTDGAGEVELIFVVDDLDRAKNASA